MTPRDDLLTYVDFMLRVVNRYDNLDEADFSKLSVRFMENLDAYLNERTKNDVLGAHGMSLASQPFVPPTK